MVLFLICWVSLVLSESGVWPTYWLPLVHLVHSSGCMNNVCITESTAAWLHAVLGERIRV